MDDETLRSLFLVGAALMLAAWLLGGFLTRAKGPYQDGPRRVELRQWGPFVWGSATFPQGRQVYSGQAFWGRVKLVRRDFGLMHLRELGFSSDNAPALDGQPTGYFVFTVTALGLEGLFHGYRFATEGTKMRHRGTAAGTSRAWRRV